MSILCESTAAATTGRRFFPEQTIRRSNPRPRGITSRFSATLNDLVHTMLLFLGGANGGIDTAEIAVSADDLVGFRRYGTAGNYLKEDKGFRRRSPDVHNSGAKRQREIVRMQRAKGEEVAGERLKQGKRQSGDNRRQHGCQGPVRPPQGGEQRSAKGTVNQDQADAITREKKASARTSRSGMPARYASTKMTATSANARAPCNTLQVTSAPENNG